MDKGFTVRHAMAHYNFHNKMIFLMFCFVLFIYFFLIFFCWEGCSGEGQIVRGREISGIAVHDAKLTKNQ